MSLNKELRELRGEMERLRIERDEWEVEAGRERARREEMEEDVRVYERMANESKVDLQRYRDEAEGEKERSRNLQDVLSEFQAGKFNLGLTDRQRKTRRCVRLHQSLKHSSDLPLSHCQSISCGQRMQRWVAACVRLTTDPTGRVHQ